MPPTHRKPEKPAGQLDHDDDQADQADRAAEQPDQPAPPSPLDLAAAAGKPEEETTPPDAPAQAPPSVADREFALRERELALRERELDLKFRQLSEEWERRAADIAAGAVPAGPPPDTHTLILQCGHEFPAPNNAATHHYCPEHDATVPVRAAFELIPALLS